MNGYNFTDRVRKVLQIAREEAARLHHEYVGTEHILLGLVREGEGVACAVLTNLGADSEDLIGEIESIVKEGTYHGAQPDLPYTSRAKKILEFSMSEARELNHSYVGTEHLLLGVLREEKGIAAQALATFGITTERGRAEVLRLLGDNPEFRGEGRVNTGEISPPLKKAMLDERFKTAIALIELHRIRFGNYPDALGDLQFLGWGDHGLEDSVRYEKLQEGYALDILTASAEKPALSYPGDFWRGLGIRRTNVGRDEPA